MKSVASTILGTEFGDFNVAVFIDDQNKEHLVLSMGNVANAPVLLRIQSECITGEVFHSLYCDCRQQLSKSLLMINSAGNGILIYLRQEGRDIGLTNKIRAYELQRQGLDTVEANLKLGFPADARTYESVAAILKELGVFQVQLITNNPDKVKQLEVLGIAVQDRIPLEIPPNGVDHDYLLAKKNKMGHWLTHV